MRVVNICGIDEAGRGPLAGPVVAAAVVFKGQAPPGLADSKKLSPKARALLVPRIKEAAHWGIGVASAQEIDAFNILQATFLAMQRAVGQLAQLRDLHFLIDGDKIPPALCEMGPAAAVVRGDATVAQIAAASILAKEHRDHLMRQLHDAYPEYGFGKHMGYGVPAHLHALQLLGPCPEHRTSFAPVAASRARLR